MFGTLKDRLRRASASRASAARPPPAALPEPLLSGDGADPRLQLQPPVAFGPPPPPGLDPRPGVAGAGGEAEMPFLDHLEELRWHIFKALGAVLVATLACFFFADWIIDVLLLGPTRADFITYRLLNYDAVSIVLQNRTITGQFFAFFGTVLATGLILGSPVVVWQIWRFIEPGLYAHERAHIRYASFYATFFFLFGVAFGYFVVSPLALQFFAQFTVSDQIANEFDISRYFGSVLTYSFGAGLMFELPVIVFVLARLGIATPALLRKGRKYALIVILVVAAFLTPPDVLAQIVLSVPLLLLYELAILQAAAVERKRKREEAKAAAEEAARVQAEEVEAGG